MSSLKKVGVYTFTAQDPVLNILRIARKVSKKKDSEIAKEAGVSPSTPRNWWNGKTISPKFRTAAGVAIACGMDSIPITPASRQKFRDDWKE